MKRRMNHFTEYLQQISKYIRKDTKQLGNEWKNDLLTEITVPEYLAPVLGWFLSCGKGLRGTLVYLAAESFSTIIRSNSHINVKKYAALMELLQNALLVHDDVMDQSNWRRNGLSVPAECAARLHAHNYSAPEEKGKAISIALGDHLISWTQQKIIEFTPHDTAIKLHSLFSKYQAKCMAGQIQDVANLSIVLEKEVVTNIYAAKTGSYTFTLPLVIGYAISSPNPDFSLVILLECLGQSLGILMQGVDDQIGFNNNDKGYHELASDLENHQPSLWLSILVPLLSDHEKTFLDKIWWGGMITRGEAAFVRQLYGKYEIHSKLIDIYRTEARIAHELINELNLESHYNKIWHGLVQYITQSSN